jgi:tetratricopeptide (TPR) repeat protein
LPQAHYLLGYVLLRENNADVAIPEFHTAIDLGFVQPRTYYQLALALRAKQDEPAEVQALNQALAADNNYAPAQCELGRILLEQQRLEEAVTHLEVAVQSNPRSEEGYFLLVKAYAGLGEKEKSAERVRQLTAVRKENRTTAQDKSEIIPAENQPAKR